jgi:hypothetical protein
MELIILISKFNKELSTIVKAYENGVENIFPTLESIARLKHIYFKKIDKVNMSDDSDYAKRLIYRTSEEVAETICLLYKGVI